MDAVYWIMINMLLNKFLRILLEDLTTAVLYYKQNGGSMIWCISYRHLLWRSLYYSPGSNAGRQFVPFLWWSLVWPGGLYIQVSLMRKLNYIYHWRHYLTFNTFRQHCQTPTLTHVCNAERQFVPFLWWSMVWLSQGAKPMTFRMRDGTCLPLSHPKYRNQIN